MNTDKQDGCKQRHNTRKLAFVHAREFRCVKRRLHAIAFFILFTRLSLESQYCRTSHNIMDLSMPVHNAQCITEIWQVGGSITHYTASVRLTICPIILPCARVIQKQKSQQVYIWYTLPLWWQPEQAMSFITKNHEYKMTTIIQIESGCFNSTITLNQNEMQNDILLQYICITEWYILPVAEVVN